MSRELCTLYQIHPKHNVTYEIGVSACFYASIVADPLIAKEHCQKKSRKEMSRNVKNHFILLKTFCLVL